MKTNIIPEGVVEVIAYYLYPIFALKAISTKTSQDITICNLYSDVYSDDVMDNLFASLRRIYPNKSINFKSPMAYYATNFLDWVTVRSALIYDDSIPYSDSNSIIKYFRNIIDYKLEIEFANMMNRHFGKLSTKIDKSHSVECIPLSNFDDNNLLNYVLLIAYSLDEFHFCFSYNNKNIVDDRFVKTNYKNILPINSHLKEQLTNNYSSFAFNNITISLERRNKQVMIYLFGNDAKDIKYTIFKVLVTAKTVDVALQIERLLMHVNKIKPFKETQCFIADQALSIRMSANSLKFNEEFGSW